MTRQAVTQHLAVLIDCRLVRKRRQGREVLFTVRPDQLAEAATWLNTRAQAWQDRLQVLKREAEEPSAG